MPHKIFITIKYDLANIYCEIISSKHGSHFVGLFFSKVWHVHGFYFFFLIFFPVSKYFPDFSSILGKFPNFFSPIEYPWLENTFFQSKWGPRMF